jgi:hypothetical protein
MKILPLILAILILGCTPQIVMHDLTKEDVFALEGIKSNEITVFGVKLGDTTNEVVDKIGEPDSKSFYEENNVANFEYGAAIGLEDLGLIFHFENYVVTRITVLSPMNKFLHGLTKIGEDKEHVYRTLGIPDDQRSEASTTLINYRVFMYTERGIEIFLTADGENRFSLVAV